ncbi:hypothetical protein GXP67_32255 [Rhodocytophaga rosea]|uniref:Uncharacterized protein n=1 Tax=Rhodocytophaga rosea TaxID=2704465 RepID=A0A6C0GSB0_9BACT|nr:hypothetical protein [Rhodocytophaga rosea]QHT70991.1 hypothetical protein GXP67_32255 [Rhodocytophaga rosea]
MTSRQYWKSLDFDFAETYSLLRGETGFHFYNQIQEKSRKEPDQKKRDELLSLSIRGSIDLLKQQGIYHPTAVKTNVFARKSREVEQLSQILQTEFIEQSLWMCGKTFRDAIVFYKGGKIVSHINICLSCHWIETCKEVSIDTDDRVFPKLREFFTAIGHPVAEN